MSAADPIAELMHGLRNQLNRIGFALHAHALEPEHHHVDVIAQAQRQACALLDQLGTQLRERDAPPRAPAPDR